MRLTAAQLKEIESRGNVKTHLISPAPTGAGVAKYRNRRTIYEGIAFDSKKEAARWEQLLLLQRAGEIQDLVRQIRYELVVNGIKVATYVADFRYRDRGREIVEDCKGMVTREYKLKKLLMLAVHKITILET
jgi:hypothetical protein